MKIIGTPHNRAAGHRRVLAAALVLALVSTTAVATMPRYRIETIGEESTVSDDIVGLMWQQQSTAAGGGLDWKDALAHCEELEFAGHEDWRLPGVVELSSIVDEKRTAAPAINTVYFADFNPGSGYWTSTTSRASMSSAYAIYFNEQNSTVGSGGVSAVSKTSNMMVLCVREETQ